MSSVLCAALLCIQSPHTLSGMEGYSAQEFYSLGDIENACRILSVEKDSLTYEVLQSFNNPITSWTHPNKSLTCCLQWYLPFKYLASGDPRIHAYGLQLLPQSASLFGKFLDTPDDKKDLFIDSQWPHVEPLLLTFIDDQKELIQWKSLRDYFEINPDVWAVALYKEPIWEQIVQSISKKYEQLTKGLDPQSKDFREKKEEFTEATQWIVGPSWVPKSCKQTYARILMVGSSPPCLLDLPNTQTKHSSAVFPKEERKEGDRVVTFDIISHGVYLKDSIAEACECLGIQTSELNADILANKQNKAGALEKRAIAYLHGYLMHQVLITAKNLPEVESAFNQLPQESPLKMLLCPEYAVESKSQFIEASCLQYINDVDRFISTNKTLLAWSQLKETFTNSPLLWAVALFHEPSLNKILESLRNIHNELVEGLDKTSADYAEKSKDFSTATNWLFIDRWWVPDEVVIKYRTIVNPLPQGSPQQYSTLEDQVPSLELNHTNSANTTLLGSSSSSKSSSMPKQRIFEPIWRFLKSRSTMSYTLFLGYYYGARKSLFHLFQKARRACSF